MELLGALALSITGIALATMSSAQLLALRPGRRKDKDEAEAKPEHEPEPPKRAAKTKESEEDPATRRSARRARPRQRR